MLAVGAETASSEIVTPSLAKRLNDLYDKGRLQQALSTAHADDLLRSVEVANLKAKQAAKAAKNAEALKSSAKGIAVKAGLGLLERMAWMRLFIA